MAQNLFSLDLELSSSQYAHIADASQTGLDITTALSIEAWVKFESIPASEMTIAGKYRTDTNNRAYLFLWNGISSQLQFVNSDDGTNVSSVGVSWTPTINIWYHVAMTKSGTTIKFYVDGAQQGTDQTVAYGTMFGSACAFAVGSYNTEGTPQSFFDGKINNLRVWDATRSGANISDNMRQIILTDPDLNGAWFYTNVYTDSSGNSNTLTAVNSPVFSNDIPFGQLGILGGEI